MNELKENKKMTKKELEKQERVYRKLEQNWTKLEGENIPSEYNSVWIHKDSAKGYHGLQGLRIFVDLEPSSKDKKHWDIKLVSEDEEKTKQDYHVIFRSGRMEYFTSDLHDLYRHLTVERSIYLEKLKESQEQEELKRLGYGNYVDKKIAEDIRLQSNESSDEESKERNKFHQKITRDLLMKYKWTVGGFDKNLRDETEKIKKENSHKSERYEYFNDIMVKDIVNDIIERHWDIHEEEVIKTVESLHTNQAEKYRQLTNKYRNKEINWKDFELELGQDIQKENPNYSAEALGEYFEKGFLSKWLDKIFAEEKEIRKGWTSEQWKDYYPRDRWGDYDDVRIKELGIYDINKFIKDEQHTFKGFEKGNEGKYSSDNEKWEKLYRDYEKEISNRVKSVMEAIIEGKNFIYSCEYCSKETKNNPEYELATRTKHNLIYVCSVCRNSEVCFRIKKIKDRLKEIDNRN